MSSWVRLYHFAGSFLLFFVLCILRDRKNTFFFSSARYVYLVGRQDLALARAEANTDAVLLTPSSHRDAVAILNESADLTLTKVYILFTSLSHLQQASALLEVSATDGTRAQKVSRIQRATAQSVVGNHLRE